MTPDPRSMRAQETREERWRSALALLGVVATALLVFWIVPA